MSRVRFPGRGGGVAATPVAVNFQPRGRPTVIPAEHNPLPRYKSRLPL